MKKLSKLLVVSLAFITFVSATFSACSCGSNKDKDKGNEVVAKNPLTEYDGGVHEFNVSDTNVPLVNNGKTEYVVVLPKTSSNSTEEKVLASVKEEFQYLFKLATNINIRIINDDGLSHNPNNRYISIGETSLFTSSGLTYDKKQLGFDGVRIMTKDNTLFLLGGERKGLLYAVYEFMEIMFHFDVFDLDSIYIDENVSNINFKNMDVTDLPDFALRNGDLPELKYPTNQNDLDNKYYGTRMRLEYDGIPTTLPYYLNYDEKSTAYRYGHNTSYCIPRETYSGAHPKWFSDNGAAGVQDQLCYTAHGDAEELRAMAEEVVKKTIWSLYRNPKSKLPLATFIMLGVEDNYNFCSCEACLESEQKYNSAGSIILFTNMYAEIFEQWEDGAKASDLFKYATADEEWLNINIGEENRAEYIRDDFRFYLRAYNNQLTAPAKYNAETDKYEPFDAKLVLRNNVFVEYADIEMDWTQSYFAKDNKGSYDNILAWETISPNGIKFYNYVNYPNREHWYYDAMNTVSPDQLAFMLNAGAIEVFFCGASVQGDPRISGFKAYFAYLESKLLWNVNEDVEELTKRYFKGAFGEAADIMYTLFEEERAYFNYQYDKWDLHQKNSIYNVHYDKKYWDKNVMYKWINDCYSAFSVIEGIKETNPKTYEEIYTHIAVEMMYPAMIYLESFRTEISQQEKLALIDRLRQDYDIMGLNDKCYYDGWRKVTYLSKLETWRN